MRAEPIQARGIATRERLINAGRELYAEVGRDKFDTQTVTQRAGVSIGTFYRYFDDRIDMIDVIDPDRDYPTLELLQKVAQWGAKHDGELPGTTPREIVDFLEDAL